MANVLSRMIGTPRPPKARYMARHPLKGTRELIAAKGAKGLVTTPAGAVLGGMVAVPLGMLALRRRKKPEEEA